MGSLDGLISRLDGDPRRRGAEFERVCRWFLKNSPTYQHELREVWLWKEWPNRWSDSEAGIDLVAEDRNGGLWAIQAKAYDPAYSVTKRDIDSFLAESARPDFIYRLLIATTDQIGQTARRTMQAQDRPTGRLMLGDLQAEQVDWPHSPANLDQAVFGPGSVSHRRPRKPRPHQREAIDAVVAGLEVSDRGQMIMACGTGKTLTSLFVKERMRARRTLVLVPSLALLAQNLREWTANATEDFDFLPVCSDDTVKESDSSVTATADLGFPVTTESHEIAKFLRRRGRPLVVFATYQSSPQIARAFKQDLGSTPTKATRRPPTFDLVIADEAHRCAGPVTSDFATILNQGAIPARKRLFMTATPRYFTGRVIREARDSKLEVASMDDESLFGPVLHRLGFASAIKRGLLTDYRVVIVGVDDDTILDWTEHGKLVSLRSGPAGTPSESTSAGGLVTDARTLAAQVGLAKAMRRFDLRKTISFHSRVERARSFADTLPAVVEWMPENERPSGDVWTGFVSGAMSTGARRALLDRLAALDDRHHGLLANARCLAEGVDLPAIDGVAFIDPRRSEVDIIQAVGRAIRLSGTKTLGTIIVPVFLPHTDDSSAAVAVLDTSAFRPVWDVIKALRAHDENLGIELDELRRSLGFTATQSLGSGRTTPPKIIIDLPTAVSSEFASAFTTHLVTETTSSWEFWFGLLQRYVEIHGSSRAPQKLRFEGYGLGSWVSAQRLQSGRLSPGQRGLLESLPDWSWNPFGDQWELSFSALECYVDQYGTSDIAGNVKFEGIALGGWVSNQRVARSKGNLADERAERLESLPGWIWSKPDSRWETAFTAVESFATREGHCRFPNRYRESDVNLFSWASFQRENFERGLLSPDRISRLEGLPGWSWSPLNARFERGYSLLAQFAESEGHCRVPKGMYVDDRGRPVPNEMGFPLGSWVANLRTMIRSGRVPSDRLARIERLRRWTLDPEGQSWEDSFGELSNFAESNGHARVPQDLIVNGISLGTWVSNQRSALKKGKLRPELAARLESVTGWSWDPKADAWENAFASLERHVEVHGNAHPPSSSSIDGFRVGSWVSEQRTARKDGRLSEERVERLSALPGWKWDRAEAKWREGFELLVSYADRTGTGRVPLDQVEGDFELGFWARNQRRGFAKGKMNPDRVALLESVPGWAWNTGHAKWEEGFAALEAYCAQAGDALVPTSFVVDEFKLGQWVSVQRSDKRAGRLSEERTLRLEALPGWAWKIK